MSDEPPDAGSTGQPDSGSPYGQPSYGQPYGQGPYGQHQGYGPAPGYPGYPAYRGTNSKAGWALGLGIAGLAFCPPTGIAAIVLGRQAKEEIARTGESGDGMATAGVVLGAIACALMALGLIVFILAVSSGVFSPERPNY